MLELVTRTELLAGSFAFGRFRFRNLGTAYQKVLIELFSISLVRRVHRTATLGLFLIMFSF